jgi:AraC-like DNA-binding protein
MVEHIAEHYTIGELAERFEISPTAMKNCFKGIYGVPIYAYFRTYRLQIAERLLREGELSVAEIAAKIGYTNPNKFTSAFCSEYGMPPTRYKKNV